MSPYLIGYKLETDHQALSANVAQNLVLLPQLADGRQEPRAGVRSILHQLLIVNDLQVLHPIPIVDTDR